MDFSPSSVLPVLNILVVAIVVIVGWAVNRNGAVADRCVTIADADLINGAVHLDDDDANALTVEDNMLMTTVARIKVTRRRDISCMRVS